MTIFISYVRVSTTMQGSSGLGIDAQRLAIRDYINGLHAPSDTHPQEFVEVESGKNSDRPQLAAALARCKELKATLLIAKLDRLSRSIKFIIDLMESKVPFVACDMPNAKPFELHIYAALAQEERRRISERTKAALAVAKARGTKLGGNRLNAEQMDALRKVRRAQRDDNHARHLPMINGLKAEGFLSAHAIARELNRRKIPTIRGGVWCATLVLRITDARREEPVGPPSST